MDTPDDHPESLHPLAGLLAAAFPGAGHLYLGHPARAAIIALGVLGLFTTGLFIGGIDCVDSREERVWFIGQAMIGPTAFAVDYLHQSRFKGYDSHGRLRNPGPDEQIVPDTDPRSGAPLPSLRPGGPPPANKSIGRAAELGTLYTAVAGMMNLICIIDALIARRAPRPDAPAGARA